MGDRYGIHFEVVRNVPLKRSIKTAAPQKNPKILLYQGVLNEGRGLEFAIEAMQQLEGVQLWLAGEGDLSDQLRRLVDQLQLQEKVRFLGYLPPKELAKVTPQAFLGLNLLENKGLSYYYSLANKCFDYIQAGVPSIQMNFPEYTRLNETYETFVLLDTLSCEKYYKRCSAIRKPEAKLLAGKRSIKLGKGREKTSSYLPSTLTHKPSNHQTIEETNVSG